MSALTLHIAVLRAEAKALVDQSVTLSGGVANTAAWLVLRCTAAAKEAAADALEAEQRELEARFTISPRKRLTAEEIEAAKTPAGGWDRETLASWGVAWPPPKGWKDALLGEEGGR